MSASWINKLNESDIVSCTRKMLFACPSRQLPGSTNAVNFLTLTKVC